MSRTRLVAAFLVAACVAAVPLATFTYDRVGSGTSCEGIGFGCSPERDLDTALVLLVYAAGVVATAWLFARRAHLGVRALAVGAACTLGATGAAVALQLPAYPHARGDLASGLREWERVLDDGRRSARPGTPLARALAAVRRTGPEPCTDAYGRRTGAARYRWSSPATPYHDPENAATAPALSAWARDLRSRRLPAVLDGSAPGRVRLTLGYAGLSGHGPPPNANGAVLDVHATPGAPELELIASTGCHRP